MTPSKGLRNLRCRIRRRCWKASTQRPKISTHLTTNSGSLGNIQCASGPRSAARSGVLSRARAVQPEHSLRPCLACGSRPRDARTSPREPLMAELTYLQAISDGLRTEMRRDKRVFVIGEDVGVYGGAFKVTQGFQEEFGAWRVMDAPLAETAIVGACTGAAIMGMRPVAEMQLADFISCAWDQLVTVAGKQRYRAGMPVPNTS